MQWDGLALQRAPWRSFLRLTNQNASRPLAYSAQVPGSGTATTLPCSTSVVSESAPLKPLALLPLAAIVMVCVKSPSAAVPKPML